MRAPRWLEMLVCATWWCYDPRDQPWVTVPYHVFNLFEGGVWVVFASLVLFRHARYRSSRLEWAYALAFFTFGLTDFREAYALSAWLIALKLVNLLILLWLRATVMRRFYPASKLF